MQLPWQENNFYLYYPESKAQVGSYFLYNLPGVIRIPYLSFDELYYQFVNLGEINPEYVGFKQLAHNFVLYMTSASGVPLGFMVFIPKRIDLIEIDIIVVKKEYRRQGYGRLMLGYLESALQLGAVLYVDHTTEEGRRFFLRCGFERDVEMFKIVGVHNRIFNANFREPDGDGVLICL